jgi:hypothetical protein
LSLEKEWTINIQKSVEFFKQHAPIIVLIIGTIPKSFRKIVEIGKIDTPNTSTYDRSLSWLDTDKKW